VEMSRTIQRRVEEFQYGASDSCLARIGPHSWERRLDCEDSEDVESMMP